MNYVTFTLFPYAENGQIICSNKLDLIDVLVNCLSDKFMSHTGRVLKNGPNTLYTLYTETSISLESNDR